MLKTLPQCAACGMTNANYQCCMQALPVKCVGPACFDCGGHGQPVIWDAKLMAYVCEDGDKCGNDLFSSQYDAEFLARDAQFATALQSYLYSVKEGQDEEPTGIEGAVVEAILSGMGCIPTENPENQCSRMRVFQWNGFRVMVTATYQRPG